MVASPGPNGTTIPGLSAYGNPFRSVKNLTPLRIDEGVDYGGSGPIYALGPGIIENIAPNGWPGQSFISEKLTAGPYAGKYVYAAENITPNVHVGQKVNKSTVIGTLHSGYPWSESGFAVAPGTGGTLAAQLGQISGGSDPGTVEAAVGGQFNKLLVDLGAPSGKSQSIVGTVPSQYLLPAPAPIPGRTYSGTIFSNPANPLAWANDLLTAGKFPKTPANQVSIIAWQRNENTTAQYNPLATTLGGQYPAFNSIGVRNYPNWTVGIQQTIATLRNGNYPQILADLTKGHGISPASGPNLYTWSGQGYNGITGQIPFALQYLKFAPVAHTAAPMPVSFAGGKISQEMHAAALQTGVRKAAGKAPKKPRKSTAVIHPRPHAGPSPSGAGHAARPRPKPRASKPVNIRGIGIRKQYFR